jgi:hypothetical protein
LRYRKLSPSGDYQFGQQQADFWINVPDAVAQAVSTRLRLVLGEWFLDQTQGTDWYGKVLGNRTALTRDVEIRQQVLGTPGATQINNFSSSLDPNTRRYSASFQLGTQYGNYAGFQPQFLAPATVTAAPPEPPVSVTLTQLSDNSIRVSWSTYAIP